MEIFNPLDPSLCDSDIEWECFPPGDDEDFESVTVYTEQEARALEKKGYTAFPFPRVS